MPVATAASAQKIKIIVDQDARGPGTSDQQALLVFLQSDKFEVLGITTVSGDQWVKEETQHTLRMLEIAQRTDVPVIQGAEFPLLNSKEETERWEALYGKLEYKGCWTDRFQANRSTIYDEPYHAPDVVPPMKEGAPHIQAAPGTAAEFIVKMVHKYPGEVVLWAGGPLTNFALALKLDPSVATLAKEFVMMGGGLYADKGAIDPGAIDARREFNWWFDPEATRIVLRAPWKKVTITPIDISVKTRFTTEMKATIAKAGHPGDAVSRQIFVARLHVGRDRRRRIDRSFHHHRPEAALHGYRCRSRGQLRQDPLLGFQGAGASLLAPGQCAIRY